MGDAFFCRGGSWKREATRRPGGWLHPSPGAPRVFWGAGCGRGIREVSAQKAERNSATPPSLPPPSPPPPLRARSSSFKPGRPEWCQLSPGRRRARKWPRSRSRRVWKSLVSRLLGLTSCSIETLIQWRQRELMLCADSYLNQSIGESVCLVCGKNQ